MSVTDIIHVLSPDTDVSMLDDLIAIADVNTGDFGGEAIGTLGTKREYAVALRVLHMIDSIADDTSGGKGGFVSSEKEGSLSRTYEVNEDTKRTFPDLVTTKWGIKLIEVIKGTFVLPMTATMGMTVGFPLDVPIQTIPPEA
jgi:hypothetical protein